MKRKPSPLLSDEEFVKALKEFKKAHPGVPVEYQDPKRQALADAVLNPKGDTK